MGQLRTYAGRTAYIEIGPVSRADGSPIDLTAAGVKLWFTAKRSKSDDDADATVRKGYGVTGLVGITVNLPATVTLNYAIVELPAGEEGLVALADTTILEYDVVLEEGGRRETIEEDSWLVRRPVTLGG